MNPKKPRVSVIMPAYNTASYIVESIKSIQNQTYTDWELIIINDGSTDNTGALAEEYAQQDPRIRVIHQQNQGASAARNAGAKLARGEFLAMQDSDDMSHPKRLELTVAAMITYPERVIVGGNYQHFSEKTGKYIKSNVALTHKRIMHAARTTCPFSHGTALMRKSAFLKVNGYRTIFKVCEDYDLILRMSRLEPVPKHVFF